MHIERVESLVGRLVECVQVVECNGEFQFYFVFFNVWYIFILPLAHFMHLLAIENLMEKAAEFLDGFFDRIVEAEIFEEFYSESFMDALMEAIRQSLESKWEIAVTGRLMHLLQFATVDQGTTEKFLLAQNENVMDLISRCLKFLADFEILDATFSHWITFMSCLRVAFSIGNAKKNRKDPQLQEILPLVDDLRNRFGCWKEQNEFDKNDAIALEIEMQRFYDFMQEK